MSGCLVRLAGHDFMDFRYDATLENLGTGGSDGCVNFGHNENAGLGNCLN